ncbi:transposase [Candidatus Poriferisodalis sp.]|uniref:transposase n=1 Tax=Candidatus Poriferisodalis sp. TaxID=3101277 RepID=UPI003B51860D
MARHGPNCWLLPTATMQTGCSLITRSAASFAHLCTTAPVPASSWRTIRRRLNFAGNRDANRALHMIVIVRLRYCERTRSYTDRRLAEHKTKKEAIRCLKRFVARELYRTLRADLSTLTTRT